MNSRYKNETGRVSRKAFNPNIKKNGTFEDASSNVFKKQMNYILGFLFSKFNRLSRQSKMVVTAGFLFSFVLLLFITFMSGNKNSNAGVMAYGVPRIVIDRNREVLLIELNQYINNINDYKTLSRKQSSGETLDRETQMKLSNIEDSIKTIKATYKSYIEQRFAENDLDTNKSTVNYIPTVDNKIQENIKVFSNQGEMDLTSVLGEISAKYPNSVFPRDLADLVKGQKIATKEGYELIVPSTMMSVQSDNEKFVIHLPTALMKKPFDAYKKTEVRSYLRGYKALFEKGTLDKQQQYEMAYAIGEYLSLMEQDPDWNANDFVVRPSFKKNWRTEDDVKLLKWIKQLEHDKKLISLLPVSRVGRLVNI